MLVNRLTVGAGDFPLLRLQYYSYVMNFKLTAPTEGMRIHKLVSNTCDQSCETCSLE
jgi:hypothetical protein